MNSCGLHITPLGVKPCYYIPRVTDVIIDVKWVRYHLHLGALNVTIPTHLLLISRATQGHA